MAEQGESTTSTVLSTRRGPRPVSAHDASGNPLLLIYRQRVSRDNPIVVELLFQGKLPEGAALFHGYGRDPYLNLADDASMPTPVFGPFPISK